MLYSYNRYLAVAARAVRRALKDGPRLQAERRGQMDLRFAKWEVRILVPRSVPASTPPEKWIKRLTVVSDGTERQAG